MYVFAQELTEIYRALTKTSKIREWIKVVGVKFKPRDERRKFWLVRLDVLTTATEHTVGDEAPPLVVQSAGAEV
jgi:hypothetical protein